MAVTEVHCLNYDNEFELADCGFAHIYLYEMHVSDQLENQTVYRVSHVSTKVKDPSQNNTILCFTLYPLTHQFLSLL